MVNQLMSFKKIEFIVSKNQNKNSLFKRLSYFKKERPTSSRDPATRPPRVHRLKL
jgi:hypothetical protein